MDVASSIQKVTEEIMIKLCIALKNGMVKRICVYLEV